jgi:hypothetical protein
MFQRVLVEPILLTVASAHNLTTARFSARQQATNAVGGLLVERRSYAITEKNFFAVAALRTQYA